MLESIGQKFLIDFGFQKDNLSLMLEGCGFCP